MAAEEELGACSPTVSWRSHMVNIMVISKGMEEQPIHYPAHDQKTVSIMVYNGMYWYVQCLFII